MLLTALVLVMGTARTAHAQFAAAAVREVPAEQTVNLFAHWEGRTPSDGLFVTLPPGWRLEEAVALQNGTRRLALSMRRSEGGDGNEYFIGLEETLRETAEFVFRVHTGAAAERERWTLVPFTYRSEQRLRRLSRYRAERRVKVTSSPLSEENYVLAFEEGATPLLLDRSRLPSLSTRRPFTVEAWLKTTGLNEVVLSAWDGTARRPYPLELVVDASGRLRYYRGRPGRHESMTTTEPVADGRWHHVAVTHDPEAGRTRLLVDGMAVDSLRGTVPLEPTLDVVALGGRVPSRAAEETPPQLGSFTGALDEVHFWPQARNVRAVHRTMRQPRVADPEQEVETRLSDGETGPILLHFENGWPNALLANEPRGVQRARSDLRFYASIADLRARSEAGAVSLSWTAPDRGTFVIERSTDGEAYRPVGRREARQGHDRYAFTDAEASGEVVFYRIRQQFPGGTERLSGTLKVGRGTPTAQKGVTLMGNFPNPFSEETTVAYEVHAETHVHLSVWDLTGQRVATLVDKTQGAGYKEVVFHPENLSSGTYFVRLRADGQMHTRKMALVK